MGRALIVILFTHFSFCFGQVAVLSTGAKVVNSSGSVSYSIGQTFYSHFDNSTGKIYEGVQQPFEIFPNSIHHGSLEDLFHAFVYPNPTENELFIKVDMNQLDDIYYVLYDINGSLIEKGAIHCAQTKINLQAYSRTVYFIKIYNKGIEYYSFKIIKI